MTNKNIEIWENIYAKGLSNLEYPNEMFVRIFNRYYLDSDINKVLDYGFGTGANLMHMAKRNCEVFGVEVSQSAVDLVENKLENNGLNATLFKLSDNKLPFDENSFDMVVAWQVLVYNNVASFKEAMEEITRVLKPGGTFIATMTATGDISHINSEKIGDYEYTSKVPGQEGATCIIVEKNDLKYFFENKELEIGEYYFDLMGNVSKHWVVVFKK